MLKKKIKSEPSLKVRKSLNFFADLTKTILKLFINKTKF